MLKKLNKTLLTTAAIALSVATLSTTTFASTSEYVSIGTGGVTGVYYPTGGAICRLANKTRKETGIRCTVESTGGSVYNINAIRNGDLEMGVAQSDWQYHAYYGTSKFKDVGAFKDLRAVFSVHAEPATIVARADSGVKHITDLKGKRFNVGNQGSGTRATWEVMAESMGMSNSDLALATELKSSEMASALCDNKIDAFVILIGHPGSLVKEVTTNCDATLVEITGAGIDGLIADNDFYRSATIPGGMYAGNPNDTTTFGVGATFVTSAAVSDKAVYSIVKGVFDNFDKFKKLHPAFNNLKESEMITDALSAPLHNGAVKYYKERGWM